MDDGDIMTEFFLERMGLDKLLAEMRIAEMTKRSWRNGRLRTLLNQ